MISIKYFFSLLLLTISFGVTAQSIEDLSDAELHAKIANSRDTNTIKSYLEIAYRLQSIYEDDSSGAYIDSALSLSDELNFHKHKQILYFLKSNYYWFAQEDSTTHLKSLHQSLKASDDYGKPIDKITSLQELALGYLSMNMDDSAIFYYNEALALSYQINDTQAIFTAYSKLIHGYMEANNEKKAKLTIDEIIELAHFASTAELKGAAYEEISNSYYKLKQPAQSLYYALKAEDVFHINDFKESEFSMIDWISLLYEETQNYAKAIEYSMKGLAIIRESGEEFQINLANQYNSVGWQYSNYEKNDSALKYFQLSYYQYLSDSLDDRGIAYPLGNIGLMYTALNLNDSAIIYSTKAMDLFVKLEDVGGVGESLINIGNAQFNKKNFKEAKQLLEEGLLKSIESEDQKQAGDAYWSLYKVNTALKNWKEATKSLLEYNSIRDSLLSFDKMNSSIRVETDLARDKDAAMIDALEAKSALNLANLKQQKIINYSIAVFAILVFISFVLILKHWKAKKKAYNKLNKQHKELELSQVEIERNHKEIAQQRDQIEEHHNDIISSIDFASRIQRALLKPEEHVNDRIPKHFIYFKPRDIVSGDFYWAVLQEPHLYLAAVDCTGHGVPGAMMSMLGIAFLNEITAVNSNLKPDEILNQLRDKIIKELNQDQDQESSYHEGMDMSLVRLDLESNELQFSGANNPLWIYRNEEVIEYKGDKQAISFDKEMRAFTSHTVQLQENDVFYIFSDGYADQFGGDKGKKLMYKPFKQFLLEIVSESMENQKKLIDTKFSNWKGLLEQVDDVCVIGVRV